MVMLRINHLLLILLLFALRSSYVNSNVRRQVAEGNVRGSSFALESLIFQPFDEAKPDNSEILKRVRPITSHKPVLYDRSQAYALENANVGIYNLNTFQPMLPSAEFHSRRIPAATNHPAKLSVVNEPPSRLNTNAGLETISISWPSPETATEKTKKRVMLRKRRRRPSNSTHAERGNDFAENRVVSSSRVPAPHSVTKVVVRNKIPAEEGIQIKKTLEMTQFQPENIREFITENQSTAEVMEQATIRKTKTRTTTTQLPPSMDLKAFLKQQTETLSLSELLQTRNLSLADLLKGNRDAAEIFKGQQPTTVPTPSVRRKVYHKTESTTVSFDKTSEHTKTEKAVEVSAPRPNYTRQHQRVSQIKPDVQVPSAQETQQKSKNDLEEVSTTKKTTYDLRSRANELRLKLRNFQRRTQAASSTVEVTSPLTTKGTTISLSPSSSSTVASSTESPSKNEIPSKNTNDSQPYLPARETVVDLQNTRPERVSNLLKRPPSLKKFGKEKIRVSENLIKKPIRFTILESENDTKESLEENVTEGAKIIITTQEPPTTTTTAETPKPEEEKIEEKDDLLELLKSEPNKSKLQKILNTRNMTLEEILENRERPTVQSDIAELFANHQKEVRYSTQPTRVLDDDGLPDFLEISKDLKTEPAHKIINLEEPYAEESMPTVARVQPPTFRESKQFGNFVSEEKEELRLNLQPNDFIGEKTHMEVLSVWNLSESPNTEQSFPTFKNTKQFEEATDRGNPNEQLPVSDIKLYENNLKKLNTNRKYKMEMKDQDFEEEPGTDDIEKSYIPPAVKSAIVASGVVMGIALFVFIAIFAACGWKQRQIRLKGSSKFLAGALGKQENKSKCTDTLSPDSFREEKKFKKTIDFDEEDDDEVSSSDAASSRGSYLWHTLKHTFTNRTITLKNRMEKEGKMRGDKATLGRLESRRGAEKRFDGRSNAFQTQDRFQNKRIDRDRNVISTSFNFRRSLSPNDLADFSECPHGF